MQSKSSLLLGSLLCLLTISVVVSAEELCQRIYIRQIITNTDIKAPDVIQTDVEYRSKCQEA